MSPNDDEYGISASKVTIESSSHGQFAVEAAVHLDD